jgi:hypothetical protein
MGEAGSIGGNCFLCCFIRKFLFDLCALFDLFLKTLVGLFRFGCPFPYSFLQGEDMLRLLFCKTFSSMFLVINIFDDDYKIIGLAI